MHNCFVSCVRNSESAPWNVLLHQGGSRRGRLRNYVLTAYVYCWSVNCSAQHTLWSELQRHQTKRFSPWSPSTLTFVPMFLFSHDSLCEECCARSALCTGMCDVWGVMNEELCARFRHVITLKEVTCELIWWSFSTGLSPLSLSISMWSWEFPSSYVLWIPWIGEVKIVYFTSLCIIL